MSDPSHTTNKVIFLGDTSVGKTTLVNKIIGKDAQISPTMGIGFEKIEREVNGTKYTIALWDTPGQENFAPISKQYFHNSRIILLVYSIDSEVSWNRIPKLYQDVTSSISDFKTIIIANKSDLIEFNTNSEQSPDEMEKKEAIKQISDRLQKAATEYADEINAQYLVASALTGNGVPDLVDIMFQMISEMVQESSTIDIKGEPTKNGCC